MCYQGAVRRLLCLCSLAVLAACRPSGGVQNVVVQSSEATATELARALGTVHAFEVKIPRGARSYAVSNGFSGPLDEAAIKSGRLRLLVGLFNLGCGANEDRLTVLTGADNFSLCVPRRSGPVTSLPSEGQREDLALNSWTPLVVFKPYLSTPGKLVVDDNVNTWTVVMLLFSQETELSGPLPSMDSVYESLR